jgi:hypothetical protein
LDELRLESPIKNILTHSIELEMASYKINDVEGLIADQEWKMKHSINTPRLSVLATVGSIASGLLISVLCFCFFVSVVKDGQDF